MVLEPTKVLNRGFIDTKDKMLFKISNNIVSMLFEMTSRFTVGRSLGFVLRHKKQPEKTNSFLVNGWELRKVRGLYEMTVQGKSGGEIQV